MIEGQRHIEQISEIKFSDPFGFKAAAVEMSYLDGVKNSDVAEKLDFHAYMLPCWRKEYR